MSDSSRRDLLVAALEACRLDIAERLTRAGYPLAVKISRPVVRDDPDGNGYSTATEEVVVSGLCDPASELALRDVSGPLDLLGLQRHLDPLASYLARSTDLADRGSPFLPELSGPDAIRERFLAPLAVQYLRSCSNIGSTDIGLGEKIGEELDAFCDAKNAFIVDQLAINGVRPSEALTHRNVTLRPLSAAERGAVAAKDFPSLSQPTHHQTDFVIPWTMSMFMPAAVLEVTEEVPWTWYSEDRRSTLPSRLVLALFLRGYDIGSREAIATIQRPVWAGFGTSLRPFPISEGRHGPDKPLGPEEFEDIVDLAYRIPKFGREEGNHREVALDRVFRGCGVGNAESGLLDFAIALEAALLDGAQQELAYKFRLYGALYLRHVRPPEQSFKDFKLIYSARSRLAHGGALPEGERRAAEAAAKELAKLVLLNAVQHGWPVAADLDQLALSQRSDDFGYEALD